MQDIPATTKASGGHPDLRDRPDGEFVPVVEAARLLDRSAGHLRRICGSDDKKWVSTGRARLIGNRWWLHRSIDARLGGYAVAATTGGDARDAEAEAEAGTEAESETVRMLRTLSADRTRIAQRKAAILRDYRSLIASGVTLRAALPNFIAQCDQQLQRDDLLGTINISTRSLRRWNREAPPVEHTARLLLYFVDQRCTGGAGGAGSCGSGAFASEAWEEFERVYLTTLRWSIAKAWRHVKAISTREGWIWPSRGHVVRLVNERIDPSQACMAREGIDVWRSKFAVKLQQHPEAWTAGELWVGDHSTLDFFARVRQGNKWVPARLYLTSWIDWRTRKLVGWYIDRVPNADTIRYALHHAIKREPGGPPKDVWIDNGKDFASYANVGMTKAERREAIKRGDDWVNECLGLGLFGMLRIQPHFAGHYNHDGKARKERFYGTLHGEFCKSFESYCGAQPGDVPVPRWVFKDPKRLPTIQQVRQRFETQFAEWYNNRCDHAIDDLVDDQGGERRRLSPNEAMELWRETVTVLPNPEVLELLLKRWERPLAVGKKLGIGLTINGRKVYYGAGDLLLERFKGSGRRVNVTYDPDDMSRIYVYDDQFRFITIAQANGLFGGRLNSAVSRQALAEGIANKKRHERAVRDSVGLKLSLASLQPTIDAGIDVQREMDADRLRARREEGIGTRRPDDPEPNIRIVQTPVDEAINAVQRAEMRQAAGAETVSPRRTGDGVGDDAFDIYDELALAPPAPPRIDGQEGDEEDSIDVYAFDPDLAGDDRDSQRDDDEDAAFWQELSP